MFCSSHIFVFWFLVFWSFFICMIFIPFFRLADLVLQNENKDYIIFSYFHNFVSKWPKTKNEKLDERKNYEQKLFKKISQCHSLLLVDKKTVAAKQQKIGGINLTTEIHLFESETSKSKTRSLVSSVPFLDPTAQTSLVALARILQTTPPLPPLSSATRSRINSPEKIMNKQLVIHVCILSFQFSIWLCIFIWSSFKCD